MSDNLNQTLPEPRDGMPFAELPDRVQKLVILDSAFALSSSEDDFGYFCSGVAIGLLEFLEDEPVVLIREMKELGRKYRGFSLNVGKYLYKNFLDVKRQSVIRTGMAPGHSFVREAMVRVIIAAMQKGETPK